MIPSPNFTARCEPIQAPTMFDKSIAKDQEGLTVEPKYRIEADNIVPGALAME